ncbi:CAP domain-containing protein [Clostridium isatidis]|uniref:CAP domain-containing protein n=1 Tax=Clostridium isatidis TaxID=182773 RepID=UPI003AAF1A08
MIKSKILALFLSGCLITGIGIGNYLKKSENITDASKNKDSIVENIENNNENSSKKDEKAADNKIKKEAEKDNKENITEKNSFNENETNTYASVNTNDKNNVSTNTTNNSNNGTSNEAPKETKKEAPIVVEENNTEAVESQAPAPSPSKETNTKPEASNSFIAEIEQAIFARVNQERAAAGLPALSYNNTMEHYARIKSQDMGDRGYFNHTNPEGQLITAQMQADGVSYRAWGENIAYISGMSGNSQLATKFMDNWMNSSGHRANILSTNFTSIGVGVYKIGNTYYATQEFYK